MDTMKGDIQVWFMSVVRGLTLTKRERSPCPQIKVTLWDRNKI